MVPIFKRTRPLLVAALTAQIAVAPCVAQPQSGQIAQTDDGPICLVRSTRNAEKLVSGQSVDGPAIVAVRKSVPELEARGFEASDCTRAGFKSPADYEKYRDQICALAGYGNEATQARIHEILGEYPAVLCANAEKVVGPWGRKAIRADQ